MSHPLSCSLDFMGVLPKNEEVKCISQCYHFNDEMEYPLLTLERCVFFVYKERIISFILNGDHTVRENKNFISDEKSKVKPFLEMDVPMIGISSNKKLTFYSCFDFGELFYIETEDEIYDFGLSKNYIVISLEKKTLILKIKMNKRFYPQITKREEFPLSSKVKYYPPYGVIINFSNGGRRILKSGDVADFSVEEIPLESDVLYDKKLSLIHNKNEITILSEGEIVGIIEDSPQDINLLSFFDGELLTFSSKKNLIGYNLNSTLSTIEEVNTSQRKSRISSGREYYKKDPSQEDVFFVDQFLTNNQMKLDYGDEVKYYPIRDRDRQEEGNW